MSKAFLANQYGGNDAVTSVNGKTGAVVLNASDIKLSTQDVTVQAKLDSLYEDTEGLRDDLDALGVDVDALETEVAGKSTVSGTHDGANWTSITIDGVEKDIPQPPDASVLIIHSVGYSTLQDSQSTAVPTLTVAQVTSAYNAITADKVVYIEDSLGDNRTMVLQKAPVADKITIFCSYLSRLELSYTVNGSTVDIAFKEIGAGGGGGTKIYQHLIHYECTSGASDGSYWDFVIVNTSATPITPSSEDPKGFFALADMFNQNISFYGGGVMAEGGENQNYYECLTPDKGVAWADIHYGFGCDSFAYDDGDAKAFGYVFVEMDSTWHFQHDNVVEL